MRAITDACSKSGVLCVIRLRKQKKEIAATVTRKNRQPNHRGVRSALDAAEEKGTRRESLLLQQETKVGDWQYMYKDNRGIVAQNA